MEFPYPFLPATQFLPEAAHVFSICTPTQRYLFLSSKSQYIQVLLEPTASISLAAKGNRHPCPIQQMRKLRFRERGKHPSIHRHLLAELRGALALAVSLQQASGAERGGRRQTDRQAPPSWAAGDAVGYHSGRMHRVRWCALPPGWQAGRLAQEAGGSCPPVCQGPATPTQAGHL